MWALLLLALPALAGSNTGFGAGYGAGVAGSVQAPAEGGTGGPMFATRQARVVTALDGGTATLTCRVHNIGDKTVSWVRSRDLVILSHAGQVFTSDARVSTSSDAGTNVLHVERLRPSDAGRYECQLNTEPKMSLFFELVIVDTMEEPEVMLHDQSPIVSVQAAAEPAPRITTAVSACEGQFLMPVILPLLLLPFI
ncbi:uncharacterized protein LOC113234940 [Hyposmocoma kahamanoa]|uniref:uncharacterized protein LOC113234940 n=1 Tax=Hyposmocoma kahamanoa TaxID=1477025 RepID=UPI000E6DA2B6|nr:uncharacterized protein LOC113234940 [Hyposmocoma kahamanoa]